MQNETSTSTPLVVVCVLSIIASVFGIFYGLGLSAAGTMDRNEMIKIMMQQGLSQMPQTDLETVVDSIVELARMSNFYILFNILEVVAIGMLLRGKTIGFHFYTGSQIGQTGIYIIVMGIWNCSLIILWMLFWIMIYWKMTQTMRTTEKEEEE